ncbi:MAG: GAF domain-containing sensor histidine kinase, partial [Actinobacteria bacterium]|nr:GAF domain-containing sensor histidine kinase [Actinomycetota bacterium]
DNGVVRYINRPFSPPALTDAVKSVLKPRGLKLITADTRQDEDQSRISMIEGISGILTSTLALDEMLDRVADELMAAFDTRACAFIRSDDEPEVHAFRKRDTNGGKSVSRSVISFEIDGKLKQDLKPGSGATMISELEGLEPGDVLPGAKKAEDCCVVPLFDGETFHGAIVIAVNPGLSLSPEEEQLLVTVSNMVSLAVAKDRLGENLREGEIVHRRLVHQCITAQEAERRRLAGEIHDGVVQSLVGVSFRLQALEKKMPSTVDGRFREDIKTLKDQITCDINEVRGVLAGLSPPTLDGTGLFTALNAYLKNFGIKNGIKVSLLVPDELPPLSWDAQINLFRVVQETLNNVEKHAKASEVTVEVDVGLKNFYLTVRDNGKGFHGLKRREMARHLGIANMRERTELLGGKISIKSESGRGTSVMLAIPLEQIIEDEDVSH